MGAVTAGLPPRIFFPRVHSAMKTLEQRWKEYLDADGPSQASELVKGRIAHYQAAGVSMSELARLEWTQVVALVHNTVPTCFWTLDEILKRPELLAAIREEVATVVIESDEPVPGSEERPPMQFQIDATKLRTSCPLLLSAFQETQRTRSITTTIRKVMADTIISPSSSHDHNHTQETQSSQSYLLKRGNYVQFPTPLLHRSREIWGANADTFDPYRFYRAQKEETNQSNPPVPSNSFLPWGFAPHVCPARQYATTSIFIVIAMVLLRYDIVPLPPSLSGNEERKERLNEDSNDSTTGSNTDTSTWPTDMKVNTSRLSTLQPPVEDINAKFKRRENWQGTWSVDVGSSVVKIPLVNP